MNKTEINISSARNIEIIRDEAFNYDGFQVVRGEFFAHVNEPTFVFYRDKVAVNAACIRKLPDVEFVQILVNPEKKQLAVMPCRESDKDSFRWCTQGKKRLPKQISCPIFSAKMQTLMNWTPEFKYKLLGKLLDTGKQMIFVFDLTTPEIFIPSDSDARLSRKATYPAEWQNQFGIPVSTHQNTLQISIFDGHAVFNIQKSNEEVKVSGE